MVQQMTIANTDEPMILEDGFYKKAPVKACVRYFLRNVYFSPNDSPF